MVTTKDRVTTLPEHELDKRKILLADVKRLLFFARITHLQLVTLNKSSSITEELKESFRKVSVVLHNFNQSTVQLLDPEMAQEMKLELKKSKVFDISAMVDLMSNVKDDVGESIMACANDFFQELPNANLDLEKYEAIFAFLVNEVKAEGGEPVIGFDKDSNSLTFKLAKQTYGTKPETAGSF